MESIVFQNDYFVLPRIMSVELCRDNPRVEIKVYDQTESERLKTIKNVLQLAYPWYMVIQKVQSKNALGLLFYFSSLFSFLSLYALNAPTIVANAKANATNPSDIIVNCSSDKSIPKNN